MNRELVSIKDIAIKANVSAGTVDRVIHKRPGVSEKTREKVQQIIKELNFKPNIFASNLAKRTNLRIGVLIPSLASKSCYVEDVLKGIVKAKNEIEQQTIKIEVIVDDSWNNEKVIKEEKLRHKNKIDGFIIIQDINDNIARLLKKCDKKQIPYIIVGTGVELKNSLCNIQQSYFESGKLAAQLFNYAFLEGSLLIVNFKEDIDFVSCISQRKKGFFDYLKQNELDIIVKSIDFNTNETVSVKKRMDKILKSNEDIKGVFVPNSNVENIAAYFDKRGENNIKLIGYDFSDGNSAYLEKGIIDFLICQKPENQGYISIYEMFSYCILNKKVDKRVKVPLDIITKSNYKYY